MIWDVALGILLAYVLALAGGVVGILLILSLNRSIWR